MYSKLIPAALCLFVFQIANAQLPQHAFSFNCTKDTTVPCGQSCLTLRTTVPVIKAFTSQYSVSSAACFRPNVSPSAPANALPNVDDMYSPVIPLPFNFPFYDIFYNNLVVGTNGTISFDIANADQRAQWLIPNGQGTLPNNSYDRAVIMGAFHDIDIENADTSPDKQIKYEVTGTAPHRRWVLTFYKVPCFQNTCWNLFNNTYQITLYEGLGLVEIHVFEREVCNSWNNGNAMIGMQNYAQDNGIMAPGRSAWTTPRWGGLSMNEAWRFAPNAGPSLLKSVELFKSTGELVAIGDTADAGNGNYNVSFSNVCQELPDVKYIVKSSYYHFEYPFQFPVSDSIIYAADTIKVVRSVQFADPVLTIQHPCPGNINGGIFFNNPVGPAYAYSINSGVFQSSPMFTNLPAGTYIATVLNSANGCIYDTIVQIVNRYGTNTQLHYPRVVYCNGEPLTPAPVINGTSGGRFSSDGTGLDIDSTTGVVTTATSDTGTYTVTYRLASNDSCVNPIAITTLRIVDNTQFVWTGAVNSNWENASNWSCDNLPGSTSNVVIYSGTVVINSNVTVNKVTIMPGANVTVNPGFNLTILNP